MLILPSLPDVGYLRKIKSCDGHKNVCLLAFYSRLARSDAEGRAALETQETEVTDALLLPIKKGYFGLCFASWAGGGVFEPPGRELVRRAGGALLQTFTIRERDTTRWPAVVSTESLAAARAAFWTYASSCRATARRSFGYRCSAAPLSKSCTGISWATSRHLAPSRCRSVAHL